jgi:hypothetical protein
MAATVPWPTKKFEKLAMRREEKANLLHPMRERMERIVLLE